MHPGCPAEVRLGLAACFFRLGDNARARLAYERVLAMEPTCADALLGLANLALRSDAAPAQGLADGLKLQVHAYELDPTNLRVLLSLGQYCLLQADWPKAGRLGAAALALADSDAMRAECSCLMARAAHAQGDFAAANQYYNAAAALDASKGLPRLGRAQAYLRSRDPAMMRNAISELQAAARAQPPVYDALHILGSLVPVADMTAGRLEEALPLFQEASVKRGEDAQVWEMLGELQAASDPLAAAAAYRKAVELHRGLAQRAAAKIAEWEAQQVNGASSSSSSQAAERPQEYRLPVRLLNNAAVLTLAAGQPAAALGLMEEAMSNMVAGEDGSISALHKVSMGYNLARLQEACSDLRSARQGYTALLEQFPGYTDCYIRLAVMAAQLGDDKGAMGYVQQAKAHEGGAADALALEGHLHLAAGRLTELRLLAGQYGKDPVLKSDAYATLIRANLFLAGVPFDLKKTADKQRAEHELTRAARALNQVLRGDPGNVYALHGLGCVLAEAGRFPEAKFVFMAVQEAAAGTGSTLELPEAWVNLASCHLALQDYPAAIRLYSTALARFYHGAEPRVLTYLARAHFDAAQRSDSAAEFAQAKRVLLRAVHLHPQDQTLRFNLAFVLQEGALAVFGRQYKQEAERLGSYKQAEKDLEQAIKLFDQLKINDFEGLSALKLAAHVTHCKKAMDMARGHLAKAERDTAMQAAKRESQARLLHAADERRKLEARKEEEAKRREKEAREAAARQAAEAAERKKEEWKRASGPAAALEAGGTPGVDGGTGKKKRGGGGGKKRASKKARMAQEEEEGQAAEPAAELDDLFGEDSEEEAVLGDQEVAAMEEQEQAAQEYEEAAPAEDEADGVDAEASPAAAKARRKRLRAADAGPSAGMEGALGLEDLEDADGAAPDGGAAEAEANASQRKKQRKAAVLEEDEDEQAPPAQAATDAEIDALFDD